MNKHKIFAQLSSDMILYDTAVSLHVFESAAISKVSEFLA